MRSTTRDMHEILPKSTELPSLLTHPREFLIRYRWALLILWAGASADLWTTLVNIEKYGAGIEAHPAQRMMSQMFGIAVGVPLAKLAQSLFVLLVAAWWKPCCRWVLVLCGILYAAAAVSNHWLLL
jgi:uncharacterized membrane protein